MAEPVYSWPYGEVAYDLDVSPDGELAVGLASATRAGASRCGSMKARDAARKGDATPVGAVRLRRRDPVELRLLARRQVPLRQLVLHRRLEHLPLRPRDREARRGEQHRDRLLPPDPARRATRSSSSATRARASCPRASRRSRSRTSSAITFLGAEIAEKHPIVQGLEARLAGDVPLDSLVTGAGPLQLGRRHPRSSRSTRSCRATRTSRRVGLRANFSDPLLLNRASLTASLHARLRPARERALPRAGRAPALRLDARLPGERRRLLRPRRPDEDEPQGLGGGRRLQPQRSSTTSRGGSTSRPSVTYYGDLDRVPDYQGIPTNFTDELATRVRLRYRTTATRSATWTRRRARLGPRLRRRPREGRRLPPALRRTSTSARRCRSRHSSVWLRTPPAGRPATRDEPFANFYFGGFRNNWVDYRDEKRYRESVRVPRPRDQRGRRDELRAGDGRVEPAAAALPPRRQAGLLPDLGAAGGVRARPSSRTRTSSALRRTITNVGGQVDFRLGVLSRLELTLSAGYAAAFESGQPTRHEAMVSLKVLR